MKLPLGDARRKRLPLSLILYNHDDLFRTEITYHVVGVNKGFQL